MNYVFLTVGNNDYRLRLSTRRAAEMEEKIGRSTIQMLMDIDKDIMPKVRELAVILHASLQDLQHGIDMEKTYDIIDAFCEDGHTVFDLVPVFIDIFRNAGLIASGDDEEEEEKN